VAAHERLYVREYVAERVLHGVDQLAEQATAWHLVALALPLVVERAAAEGCVRTHANLGPGGATPAPLLLVQLEIGKRGR
jgi:hypothetical protein